MAKTAVQITEEFVYVGKDLEAMSFAPNYHKWILDEFRSFLGKRIIEVGAGTGTFSNLLLKEKPETLSLVEPSEMFDALTQNISEVETETQVEFYRSIFATARHQMKGGGQPDSIFYVNVLEHIEDDRAELKMIYDSLARGGRCFIFVPALMSLYGEFDRSVGHYRRYTKREIEEKCLAAGFRILKSKYFDFAGVFPWWIKYRLLRSSTLGGGSVALYDKIVVPLTSRLEMLMTVPLGKNLILVSEKS